MKPLKYIVYLTISTVPSVLVELAENENPKTWWYQCLRGTGEGYFRDIEQTWWRSDLIAGIKLADNQELVA
jgi:hypothetical protein